MFSSVLMESYDAGSDTLELVAAGYSIKQLDWTYEFAGDAYPRQNATGNHPAQSFVRQMTGSLIVQVTGTSVADYWTKRKALVRVFLPDALTAQTEYPTGTLKVTPAGGSQMQVDVNVTSVAVPLTVDNRFEATATIEFRADQGYWADSGGTAVYA